MLHCLCWSKELAFWAKTGFWYEILLHTTVCCICVSVSPSRCRWTEALLCKLFYSTVSCDQNSYRLAIRSTEQWTLLAKNIYQTHQPWLCTANSNLLSSDWHSCKTHKTLFSTRIRIQTLTIWCNLQNSYRARSKCWLCKTADSHNCRSTCEAN